MTDPSPNEEVEAEVEVLVPAANVIEALARVQAEIGGIRKLTQAQRRAAGQPVEEGSGVKWAYRGIDQITQAAQPLFGKHGVVITPDLKSHVVDEIVVNDRPWTDTTVIVKWTIYGPGGVDDRITAKTIGIGRDNSDKGYNKAMTGAYKNLLLRVLTVGDPQDDTDQHSHPTDEMRLLSTEQAQEIVEYVVGLPEVHKAAAKAHIAETWGSTKQIPARDWEGKVAEFFEKFDAIVALDAAGEPSPRAVEVSPGIIDLNGEPEPVCVDCGEVGHAAVDCTNGSDIPKDSEDSRDDPADDPADGSPTNDEHTPPGDSETAETPSEAPVDPATPETATQDDLTAGEQAAVEAEQARSQDPKPSRPQRARKTPTVVDTAEEATPDNTDEKRASFPQGGSPQDTDGPPHPADSDDQQSLPVS